MSILIGQFEFDGPFGSVKEIRSEPGIFALLFKIRDDDYELIELNHTGNVKESLNCFSDVETVESVFIAVCYMDAVREDRQRIVDEISSEFEEPESDRIQYGNAFVSAV